jgi:hypothetical protein
VPVAAVLHEHGVTADRVEEEIVRLEGLGPAAAHPVRPRHLSAGAAHRD